MPVGRQLQTIHLTPASTNIASIILILILLFLIMAIIETTQLLRQKASMQPVDSDCHAMLSRLLWEIEIQTQAKVPVGTSEPSCETTTNLG